MVLQCMARERSMCCFYFSMAWWCWGGITAMTGVFYTTLRDTRDSTTRGALGEICKVFSFEGEDRHGIAP
jgi:hypothetical protein